MLLILNLNQHDIYSNAWNVYPPNSNGFGIKAIIKNDQNGAIPSNHFKANKMVFESLFYFYQAPTILRHIITRDLAFLGRDPNQGIS